MSSETIIGTIESDAIQKAMEKGYQVSDLQEQTWEDCLVNLADRKLVVYGLGNGIYPFLHDYGIKLNIYAAVDAKKMNATLADLCFICTNEQTTPDFASKLSSLESVPLIDPSALDNLESNEVVVIIISLLNYMEIYQKLKQKGFKYVYSYLCMEANKRQAECWRHMYPDPKQSFLKHCQKMNVDSNLVLVDSIGGYCDHARQIVEQLRVLNPDLRFTWLVLDKRYKKKYQFPSGIDVICYGTPKYYQVMSTAKLWLLENPIAPELPKKSVQVCVQLKHWASVTLKTFGYMLDYEYWQRNSDSANSVSQEFIDFFWKKNAKITDCCIVGSYFDEHTVRKGFLYQGECFYAGSPRSDVLFNGIDYKKEICYRYGIDYNSRILLYTPTFRFDKSRECAFHDTVVDFCRVKEILESKFGGYWCILMRLHPRVLDEFKKMNELPDFVTDVSSYPDSEELVSASDMMLADYSSIMFEPAFVGKPVFLYAPDLDTYLRDERSFLIPYESLPFPRACTNAELIDNIISFDQDAYEVKVKAFLDKYGVHEDGHASERAARHIFDLICESENQAI